MSSFKVGKYFIFFLFVYYMCIFGVCVSLFPIRANTVPNFELNVLYICPPLEKFYMKTQNHDCLCL